MPSPRRSLRARAPDLLEAARLEPRRSAVVLVSVPVLIIVFTYFGSNDFYRRALSSPGGYDAANGFIYHHLGAFVILGCGSVLLGGLLGFTPRQLGLGLGDAAFGIRFCAFAVPLLVVPITLAGSYTPDVAREYPVAKAALDGPGLFLRHAAFYLLYYVGWEAFFRGYMLFGLMGRFGGWTANLLQMIPSTLIHTSIVVSGKPFAETLGAVPAGLVLGWLTLRTRSIWYAVAIHGSIGILTDFWQYLHAHGVL